MKLLDSLNDGKTKPESPAIEETKPEPSPEDGSGEKKDEDKKGEEVTKEGEEEGQKVSNIHVAAKVGAVSLLLHSKNGNLATVSIKGRLEIVYTCKKNLSSFHTVFCTELCTDVDLKDDDIIVRAWYDILYTCND